MSRLLDDEVWAWVWTGLALFAVVFDMSYTAVIGALIISTIYAKSAQIKAEIRNRP